LLLPTMPPQDHHKVTWDGQMWLFSFLHNRSHNVYVYSPLRQACLHKKCFFSVMWPGLVL
jgi:hypothetical protein